MARDANTDASGHLLPRDLDCRPYRVTIQREVWNDEVRQMIDWCKDPELPGSFRHYNRFMQMHFTFSDQNVAFQFKIRWG